MVTGSVTVERVGLLVTSSEGLYFLKCLSAVHVAKFLFKFSLYLILVLMMAFLTLRLKNLRETSSLCFMAFCFSLKLYLNTYISHPS